MRRHVILLLVLLGCSSRAEKEAPASQSAPQPVPVATVAPDARRLVLPPAQIEIPAGEVQTIDLQCGDNSVKDSRIRHTVSAKVDGFKIDDTVVRCDQWDECVERGACRVEGRELCRHGFVVAPREEAEAYCRWRKGRLPSWSEWYRAARAASSQRFPMGLVFDPSVACKRPSVETSTTLVRCEYTSSYGMTYGMRNPNAGEWTRDNMCVLAAGTRKSVPLGIDLNGDELDWPYLVESGGKAEFRCVSP